MSHFNHSILARAIPWALVHTALPAMLLLNPPAYGLTVGPFVEQKAEMVWKKGGNPDYPLGLQPPLGWNLDNRNPAFADFDGDGDLDLVVGTIFTNTLQFYENIGNAVEPIFVLRYENRSEEKTGVLVNLSHLIINDEDGDGDLDILVNIFTLDSNPYAELAKLFDNTPNKFKFNFFENTGDFAKPKFTRRNDVGNLMNGIDINLSNPSTLVDFDADGDLDFFTIKGSGITYFENMGTSATYVFDRLRSKKIPLEDINEENFNIIMLVDLDADKDLDLFIKIFDSSIKEVESIIYFENIGSSITPTFKKRIGEANPLDKLNVGFISTFADLDADGDFDLVNGSAGSDGFVYYENTGSPTVPIFTQHIGATNLFSGYTIDKSALADLDADGDFDLLTRKSNSFVYFENTGNPTTPIFTQRIDSNNPFKGDLNAALKIDDWALADLDMDGDLDFLIRDDNNIAYFENIGNSVTPNFVERTDSKNPFTEIDVSTSLAIADLDNDRDLDLLVGKSNGIAYFENTGTPIAAAFTENHDTTNFLNNVNESGNYTSLILIDLDADKDFDLVTKRFSQFFYFENVGTPTTPKFTQHTNTNSPNEEVDKGSDLGILTIADFLNGVDGKSELNIPAMADLDDDGDVDLLTERAGKPVYLENTRTLTMPMFIERQGIDNPLNGIRTSIKYSAPALADLDADGDVDLLVGIEDANTQTKEFLYFQNIGTPNNPIFSPLLNLKKSINSYNIPSTFVDLDLDGDLDLLVGEKAGTFTYFENTGTSITPMFVERKGTNNPLYGEEVGNSEILSLSLADLDADGDFDLLVGRKESDFLYYKNTGTATTPIFTKQSETNNPLTEIKTSYDTIYDTAILADLDKDKDFDLLIGGKGGGYFSYLKNVGTSSTPTFMSGNSFDNNSIGDYSNRSIPALADLDADGDLDLLTGGEKGFVYFENISPTMLSDVYALPRGGTFPSPRLITLNCQDCESLVYRLGNDLPQIYQAPFVLEQSTTLHYAAVNAKGQPQKWLNAYYYIDTQLPEVDIPEATAGSYALDHFPAIFGEVSDGGGSGIQRIELQISNNTPFFFTGSQQEPFTQKITWLPISKISLTTKVDDKLSAIWEYTNLDGLPLPLGIYTLIVRAFDKVGNVSEPKQWTIYNVDQAFTNLSLKPTTTTLVRDGKLTVTGKLTRLPLNDEINLQGLPIELSITTPNDTVRQYTSHTHTTTGQYEFKDLSDFNQSGTYTLRTHFEGNPLLEFAESPQQTISVGESLGYAVLVQGSLPNNGNDTPEGLDAHQKTLDRIYQTLVQRGLRREDIYYLRDAETTLECDDQTPQPAACHRLQTPPTQQALQDILANTATDSLYNKLMFSPAPLYIVLIDHGSTDGVFYPGHDKLTAEQLHAGLLQLENNLIDAKAFAALVKPRFVILGFCYSGQFIPDLALSGRIIMSSAAQNEVSYKGLLEADNVRNGEFFIDSLFQQLHQGASFSNAFTRAATQTHHYTDAGDNPTNSLSSLHTARQTPRINLGNDKQLYAELPTTETQNINLDNLRLGVGVNSAANDIDRDAPLHIVRVHDTLFVPPDSDHAELWIDVNNGQRVAFAPIDIRRPQTPLPIYDDVTEQQIVTMQRIEGDLACDGQTHRCRKTVTQFDMAGKYTLYYFVQNIAIQEAIKPNDGEISAVYRAVVYKQLPPRQNQPPAPFDLHSPAQDTVTSTSPMFIWHDSLDPENHAVTYSLIIQHKATGEFIHREDEILQPWFHLKRDMVLDNGWVGLRDLQEYTWWVEAVDAYGAVTKANAIFNLQTDNTNKVGCSDSGCLVFSPIKFNDGSCVSAYVKPRLVEGQLLLELEGTVPSKLCALDLISNRCLGDAAGTFDGQTASIVCGEPVLRGDWVFHSMTSNGLRQRFGKVGEK